MRVLMVHRIGGDDHEAQSHAEGPEQFRHDSLRQSGCLCQKAVDNQVIGVATECPVHHLRQSHRQTGVGHTPWLRACGMATVATVRCWGTEEHDVAETYVAVPILGVGSARRAAMKTM